MEPHFVSFVPQSQQLSCWAASTAMMIGYKHHQTYPESAVLEQFRQFGTDGANERECQELAHTLGFNVLPNQCSGPAAWEEMLARGPIMVGSPNHVIVVAGISGDGTPLGTQLYILDPAIGEGWGPFLGAEEDYELNPSKGYYTNLFQWP